MDSSADLLMLIAFVLFLERTSYLGTDSYFKMSDKNLTVCIIFLYVIVNF